MKNSWLCLLISLLCLIAKADICAICQEEIGATNDIKELCCSHKYHANCLFHWAKVNSTCPICKKNIILHRSFYIFTEHDLCSRLMIEGLNLNNIHLSHKVAIKELKTALQSIATAEYQQFLIAEKLEKKKQDRIKKQRELEEKQKKELEQEINFLCKKIKELSIEDSEYDNPESMDY